MTEPVAKRVCSAVTGVLKRIAVEGNIATGKSTFIRFLEQHSPSYHVVSEPLTKWQNVSSNSEVTSGSQAQGGNLLDLFYKEPSRWAYTFQSYACLSRLRAQTLPPPPSLLSGRDPVQFFERSVFSDKFCFALNCYEMGLISDVEWNIYCDWHAFLLDALNIQLDGFIYLRAEPHVCMSRLQHRHRNEEGTVTLEYLESLHDKHDNWLLHKKTKLPKHVAHAPVLVLNCNDEFENDGVNRDRLLKQVTDFIQQLPSSGGVVRPPTSA